MDVSTLEAGPGRMSQHSPWAFSEAQRAKLEPSGLWLAAFWVNEFPVQKNFQSDDIDLENYASLPTLGR